MPARETGCSLGRLGKASQPKSRVMIELREMCRKEHSISRKSFTARRRVSKSSELGIVYETWTFILECSGNTFR